jgi:cell wall-associated NlpC family hydrolase
MWKIYASMWLGSTTALMSGCAPMPGNYYPQGTQYTYNNYYPASARPYYTAYHPNYQPNYPTYSQGVSQSIGEPADAPARRALLAQAHRSLGIPYKLGGETPREGFDCSGLTQFIYKQGNGITLPRTAAEQSRASHTISFEQMRPGDLIFFHTSGRDVNHVGIYIGRGNFIHAASGGGKVTIDNLSKTYWQQRLAKFGSFMA